MKRTLILIPFLLISSFLFSQQVKIDSLKDILKTSKIDTIKLNSYSALTSIYGGQDVKLAQKYLDSMFDLATLKRLKKYELTGYSQKGVLCFRQGKIQEAIDVWKKALLDIDIDKYPIQKGNYFNNIAVGYKAFKKTDSVIKYLTESIKLNEELENNLGLIANYFGLSDFYFSINEFDKSIQYLQKLENIALKTGDEHALARTNILLASISRREFDFEDAIMHFDKALDYFKAKEPSNLIMLRGLQYEITKTKMREKKYEEAIVELNQLKSDFEEILDGEDFWSEVNRDLLVSYNNTSRIEQGYQLYKTISESPVDLNGPAELWKILAVSKFEILTNRIKKYTIDNLKAAIILAEEAKDGEGLLISLELLTLAHLKEYNYEQAVYYLNKGQGIKDSINFTQSKIINLAQKRKFNEALKENENLELKQQNAEQALLTEKEKTHKWAMGGGLAISLSALGIFFLVFRKNQKQKREIEKQKDLVEQLQRELHHRLKNNLSFIDFFITLAKGKFPDPAYREKLDELQNRISSMFEVHRQLFKKEDVTSVNAKTYISALVENVKKAYDSPNISLEENVTDTNLRADTSFPIGLIVNEFVTNSYKYAFPNNENGVVSINLKEENNVYHLQLSDNGKGLPLDFDINNLNSFGMETIKLLTQEYKGTFKLDGNNGTKMDITFPKDAA